MKTNEFRGKRLDNDEYSYGDLIQLLGEQGKGRMFIVDNRFGACIDKDGSFVNTGAPFVNEVDPKTVAQYIGINTTHYKEKLYEGDAIEVTIPVSITDNNLPSWDASKYLGYIVYKHGTPFFKLIEKLSRDDYYTSMEWCREEYDGFFPMHRIIDGDWECYSPGIQKVNMEGE